MDIKEHYSLANLTTFRIGGEADFFVEIGNEEELVATLLFAKEKKLPVLIVGGGSNLLVSDQGYRGVVIKVNIKGREIVKENAYETFIKVGSGEVWDEVVAFAVTWNLWGIENLSGIPGLTGGVPVQNVGAYGQEVKDVIEEMEVLDLITLEKKIINNMDAGFGYRKSNFNTLLKNRYAILSITFKLSRRPKPNLEYMDLKRVFENNTNPSLGEIRSTVIEIRKEKFPDLNEYGCAGSCFKNFILEDEEYKSLLETIKKNFDQSVVDRLMDLRLKLRNKVPAAFLIDICGLKGKQVGNAKLWEKQPLVIVNTGNATASDVVELFEQVKNEVFAKTGLTLTPEPEFISIE